MYSVRTFQAPYTPPGFEYKMTGNGFGLLSSGKIAS